MGNKNKYKQATLSSTSITGKTIRDWRDWYESHDIAPIHYSQAHDPYAATSTPMVIDYHFSRYEEKYIQRDDSLKKKRRSRIDYSKLSRAVALINGSLKSVVVIRHTKKRIIVVKALLFRSYINGDLNHVEIALSKNNVMTVNEFQGDIEKMVSGDLKILKENGDF